MTGPRKYRKKPVEIEAVQWDGTDETSAAIRDWAGFSGVVVDTEHIRDLWDYDVGAYRLPTGKVVFAPYQVRCLIVLTLEGEMVAELGSWIIRGVRGELYPCRDDIFRETYEV